MRRKPERVRDAKALSVEGLRAIRDILLKTRVRLRIIRDLLRRR